MIEKTNKDALKTSYDAVESKYRVFLPNIKYKRYK